MSLLLLFNQPILVGITAQLTAAVKAPSTFSAATPLLGRGSSASAARGADTVSVALLGQGATLSSSYGSPTISTLISLTATLRTSAVASASGSYAALLRGLAGTRAYGRIALTASVSIRGFAQSQAELSAPNPLHAAPLGIPAVIAQGPLSKKRLQNEFIFSGTGASPQPMVGPLGSGVSLNVRGSYTQNAPLIVQAPLTRKR